MILLAAALLATIPTPGGVGETVLVQPGVAVASAPATRIDPPQTTTTAETVAPPSLFAPEGLSGCDEFRFYRQQFGLPAKFDQLAWRESNCRNEDGVHTSCCYGYLQLNVTLHMQDHRIGWRYRDNCDVDSYQDVNSDTAIDKWRQVCAAAQLYAVMGYSPWSL